MLKTKLWPPFVGNYRTFLTLHGIDHAELFAGGEAL
jgi:hypothetical protein